MKEDFLHYLWKFKIFNTLDLKTTEGELVAILHVGHHLEQAGPDFFNAQIKIANQKWAGNVEIHLKSSDWYAHHHEKDNAYENVILHVVWEHDTPVYRSDNTTIPVLELKKYVAPETILNYQSLRATKSWLFCEKQLIDLDDFLLKKWQERLFFERLEKKSQPILELLNQTGSDWEAVLFCILAKNFGLNTNAEAFFKVAHSIPFSILRKESFELENIEALLLGQSGLLDSEKEDVYFKDLKFRYFYLLHKYQLDKTVVFPVQFFKHRPDNFPTIRLSQLAALYHSQRHLFSSIINAHSVAEIYKYFQVGASSYWKTHYQFDKLSSNTKKLLSKSFVDLLIINAILPIQFAYAQSQGKENSEYLIRILFEIAPEKNTVIDKFGFFGIRSKNAFETQSLLQMKKEYCDKSRCLECAIGMELMKNK